MEVPLQQVLESGIIYALWCGFNPCFNGSSSSTVGVHYEEININYVSILVLMEVPLQQNKSINGGKACSMFQSLF